MVMHVDETLAADSRRNLERTMTSQRGVLDAYFNERRPHLMLVQGRQQSRCWLYANGSDKH